MELDKKQGFMLQWLIGIGDLVVLNLMFMLVYVLLDPIYTQAIVNNLREVILLLNFCYFFSLYFIPIQLHRSIVYLDKVVQRAFGVITLLIFLFATCLVFLKAIAQNPVTVTLLETCSSEKHALEFMPASQALSL